MKLQTLNKKQIQQLFKKGHSLSNDLFAIKFAKSAANPGVCISFSKKLKLNKPQKNKFKRQIRDLLSKNVCQLSDFQFIIILLKTPSETKESYNLLSQHITELLSEINNPHNEI